MDRVQENLLKVLSGALWNRISNQTFSESEWTDILDLAEDQGVLFLVLQGIPVSASRLRSLLCNAMRESLFIMVDIY